MSAGAASNNTLGIVFAGGGTGGHLFPALAVLEQLLEIEPGVRAVFLCSTREIDERILAAAGVPHAAIPAKPLSGHPIRLAKFITSWGGAVRASRDEIRKLKAECARVRVLATGGFVAAPVAQAARAERVPLVLLNQDAPPGKANRWIAGRAASIYTTAEVARAGWERIPPVVRRAAIGSGDAAACRTRLGLDPDRPVLLVTGASQGSRSVNEFAAAFADTHGEALRSGGWQAVHQTGAADNTPWRGAWDKAGVPAVVEQFFDAMGDCWGAADVAVSRAGAGSVAEVWANRVPTVFMPYPYHRDEHQRLNAQPLAEAGGAVVAKDAIEPAANLAGVGPKLLELVQDTARRATMRDALAGLGPVDGAARLARALLADG